MITKIKHIWSVLCKESVINQDNNLIYIQGTLEELKVSLKPIKVGSGKLPEKLNVPINYEIVSLWFKENRNEVGKAQIEYSLISPEGKELVKNIQDMEIPVNIRRFRSRLKISGLPVTKEGDYSFRVKIKEAGSQAFRLVSELPLEVKIKIEPPIEPTKNTAN